MGSLEPAEGDWEQHKATLERRELFRDFIIKYQTKTDQVGYMSVSGKAYFDDAGQFKGYRGTGKDITAQKSGEELMRRRAVQQGLIAAFWQQALESINLDELLARAVAIIRQGLSVEFCNVLQLAADGQSLVLKAGSGWQDGWIGRRVDSISPVQRDTPIPHVLEWPPSLTSDSFQSMVRLKQSEIFKLHGICSGIDMTVYGHDSPYGLLGAYSSANRQFSEEDVNFLKSIANILGTAVERKKSEEKLAYLAQFDPLTGLPNRSLFRDRLAQTLTIAQRNGSLVGVMFADLDRFKNVNDTLGHDIGDQLLLHAAERLSNCVRPGDTVARLGGDEFALILFNLAKADDCALIAQKVVIALAPPFDLKGQQVFITASLGIAAYPADGGDSDILLKNADTAMYRAKELGRNGYQFYVPDMNERAVERLAMEVALRGALERREFLLQYQPKVNVASGQISGFEALLRWQHPERGLVPPAQFISILEDTGLIVAVGEWVIRSACEQLKTWENEGIKPCSIAINLSARQFRHVNLDSVVGQILKEADVNPHLLEFELTESLLMSDADQAVQTLRNLKAYGVRLSVDDFGTGYSSLAYLKRFPLDALKIDRTFISNVTTDVGDATIALAIINLAHSLKLTVVAEGVETKEQLEFLRAHVCDEMQGYYFARPMSAKESTMALVNNRQLSEE
ncbi:MAG TPA: EAL domain-containing protein [Pyrinomonadaceae bacterium]|nr:EAL domain-containing protein [Pyrinomonadaceae bacterium]